MRTRCLIPVLLVALAVVHAAADGERLFDPTFRALAPGDVLVKGDVALTRGDVDAFVDLFESAFDLAFTGGREQTLRDLVEGRFEQADADARRQWLALVEPLAGLRESARAGKRDDVKRGFRRFRGQLDEQIRGAPDEPLHVLLAEVLESRYHVVWAGDPAIKQTQADVYLELARFVTSAGRGTAVRATAGQLHALRDDLEARFRETPRAQRQRLQNVHRTWLAAKAAWDRGGEPRRFPFRWRAVKLMAKLAPPDAKLTVKEGTTLADYAREAARVAAAQKAYDAFTNVAHNPKRLLDIVEAGLKVDPSSKEFTFQYR